ncbi:MAG: hypothetical protein IT364_00735 [Candidatus Hydrogenedentes bacterium]|nr:hypothetical protein [Candidatus Hydrogenedentota bacterium]
MDSLLELTGLIEADSEDNEFDLASFIRTHPLLSKLAYGLLGLLLTVVRGCQIPPSTEGEIEPCFYRHSVAFDGGLRSYEVYVPDHYDANASWPLILFWHGIMESGDDGCAHLDVGIGPAIRKYPERYPCIVAFPQLPWNTSAEEAEALFEAVQTDVQTRYTIDPNRIYATGISYGAGGTWRLAAHHPGQFAAIVPIAGCGNTDDIPGLLHVAIWTFASAEDTFSGGQRWRDFVKALCDAGASVKATEFSGSSHTIWNRVYQDPAVTDWLFNQSTR